MKLSNDFILHNDGNEIFLIPTGNADFSGVVRGNSTFRSIVELLQNEITEDEIVSALLKKYDAPEEIIKRDTEKAIENLRGIGALIG